MICVFSAESHHLKRCNVVGTFNYLRLQLFPSLLRLRSSSVLMVGVVGENLQNFILLLEAGIFFYIKKKEKER